MLLAVTPAPLSRIQRKDERTASIRHLNKRNLAAVQMQYLLHDQQSEAAYALPFPVLSALEHFPEDFGLAKAPAQKAA